MSSGTVSRKQGSLFLVASHYVSLRLYENVVLENVSTAIVFSCYCDNIMSIRFFHSCARTCCLLPLECSL